MSAGLFSRLKNWAAETLTNEDLNAEFDNIISNMEPDQIGGHSDNATEMKQTTDPGEVGTESLATNVSGEIERLRHVIGEISGTNEWYETPVSSILGLSNAIGSGLTDNRLVSGKTASGSLQPVFLNADGTAATVNLKGATTNFVYYVEGTEYTISTDITLTGLTAAPSSNNTCLVNDAIAADQEYTKYTGENGTEIPVDNMGSEISSLVGQWAAFSLTGTATEYFIAYVESSTRLTKARRGFFFNASDVGVDRAAYTNNDVITLLKLTWVFAKSDGTLTATYNNPVWSDDQPSSPALGDYWFDYSDNKWKVYGVGSYSDADAMLIGVCAQDTTNCIAARSFEFFKNYDETNTCELQYVSATEVHAKEHGSQVSVWGSIIKNDWNKHIWDITADRDTGVSESSSTTYYVYLTETGDTLISDIRPHDRRMDLRGFYHPHKSWRCLGSFRNDGSSDIEADSVFSYASLQERKDFTEAKTAAFNLEVTDQIQKLDSSGGAFTAYFPPAALWAGQTISVLKSSSDYAAITLDGYGSETINGSTTYVMYYPRERVDFRSDGSEIFIDRRHTGEILQEYHIAQNGTSGSAPAITNGTGEIEFNLAAGGITNDTTRGTLIVPTDDSGNTRTKFIANAPCKVDIAFYAVPATNGAKLQIFREGSELILGHQNVGGNIRVGVNGSIVLEKDEFFSVALDSGSLNASAALTLTFTARAL